MSRGISPASTSTTSPTFRLVLGTSLKAPRSDPGERFALVSVRRRRSDSACALPRPSAIARQPQAAGEIPGPHSASGGALRLADVHSLST
jgi:hypothetical protein